VTDLEGAILAGGASRRMGRDKALLLLDGSSMLERVFESMAPLTPRIRIMGRSLGLETRQGLIPAVPDRRPGLGPLSGIHTALLTASAEWVLVVACDLPFVTTRFLRALVAARSPQVEAVAPRPASGTVPVCALYRTSCVPALEERLRIGRLGARDFVDSLSARFFDEAEISRIDPDGRCLLNVNTPEDYEMAARSSNTSAS
jgi:molybdenum cofactor guanylyltransferase